MGILVLFVWFVNDMAPGTLSLVLVCYLIVGTKKLGPIYIICISICKYRA